LIRLWDYLRRSGMGGYYLPLSGGADSGATAAIVGSMTIMVFEECKEGNPIVLKDLRRICNQKDDWVPKSPQEIAGYIFHTTYMGTVNSSDQTRSRAKSLAAEIGSFHYDINIDIIIDALVKVFVNTTEKTPNFKVNGGTWLEDLALQNIQARIRMVLSYFFAQTLGWVRGLGNNRQLLVLGSANVDEGKEKQPINF